MLYKSYALIILMLSVITSISANADGLRDAASRKVDHVALPTKYNYQATSVGRWQIVMQTENCRLLRYIWTIMLKLHLVDLLSLRYTTNFATNTVTNRTDGAYALVYCTYSVDRRRWNKPRWSIVDLIDPS